MGFIPVADAIVNSRCGPESRAPRYEGIPPSFRIVRKSVWQWLSIRSPVRNMTRLGDDMELIEVGQDEWHFSDSSLTSEIMDEFHDALNLREEGRDHEAESVISSVLTACPNHIDALHHLGLWLAEEGDALQSYALCLAAVGAGLHAVPPRFSWATSKLPWPDLDNRPFLRAYHCLGIWRMDQRLWDQAIEIFSRLLRVNPNDNQGARYLLPQCWFEKGDSAAVIELCRKFPEDPGPDLRYSNALALVLSGQEAKARESLAQCVQRRPLVAEELLRSSHPEPDRKHPGMITLGGADEAWEYWRNWGPYWERSEKAMDLLREASG